MSGGHDGSPQEPQWPSNPYFGEPWDAPAVEGARQVPTPVGQPCAWCTIPVAEGDQGFMVSCVRRNDQGEIYGSAEPFHRECQLRSVVGSPAHLEGRCTCHGGADEGRRQTPQEMRAEAIEVWGRVLAGRIGPRSAA